MVVRTLTRRAPLKIGLTGGIASGKSAAGRCFEALGVPVIDTDQLAREVVAPGEPALQAVVDALGSDLLTPEGSLDRRALRARVFANAAMRQRLEGILHPAIRQALAARLATISAPYVVIAIPLLAETGRSDRVDRVLVIDCPPETQLTRLLARDGETEAGARAILAAQASREARLAIADDVVENIGSIDDLARQILALHQHYQALARPPS